jgi:FixJ family two-component response regulator
MVRQAHHAGMNDYIAKPITLQVVAKVVERWLDSLFELSTFFAPKVCL